MPHRHDAPGQEEGRLSARAPCAADGRLDTARLPGRRPLERLQPSRGAACLIWPRTGRPRVTRDNSGGFAGLGLPSGAEAYPIADALGSVIALTDGTGAKTDTYKYDPYGGNTGVTGTTPNPSASPAKHGDPSTLYKIGLRYYCRSPEGGHSGPCVAPEPQQPAEGMAWNYVGDNPVNFTDPTGAWELRDHVWSMIEATVCGAIGFANFYAASGVATRRSTHRSPG